MFPGPRARPQFVFDGPSPNLNLAATAHNLYLPALPTICIYRPRGLNLYLPALAN